MPGSKMFLIKSIAGPSTEYMNCYLITGKRPSLTLYHNSLIKSLIIQNGDITMTSYLGYLRSLMNHLVQVFRKFQFIILKDFDNRGWFTSDNPVIVDKQNNHSWIVPLETEIYFPLSKDYCLFMFHEDSEIKTNPLRHLTINKISDSDEVTHKSICDRTLHNDNEYLIFPTEIDKTFFDDSEKNGT